MSETVTFGQYVAAARKAEGLSLRALGERMGGLSAPYLHDVEHDRRRLALKRWPALVAALEGATLHGLAKAAAQSGTVEIDASGLSAFGKQALARVLLAAVRIYQTENGGGQ